MKHHINRTSPKGQAFIGTCYLCGKPGLKFEDAQNDCENVRGLTVEEALVEGVTGSPLSSQDHHTTQGE